MGGAMAFYRHFVERKDFDLFVATDDRRVLEHKPPYPVLIFQEPAWLGRLSRTRLSPWIHSYKNLFEGNSVPAEVLAAAKKFKPDLIFTIGGSWNWTTQMSKRLARELGVPLVASFNDWFDFGNIIHPLLHASLEKKFRAFYWDCDLAFCTSEGMREELGSHRNAHVLYPIGANAQTMAPKAPVASNGKFVIAFAGNLGNWYGEMLEQLITASLNARSPIEFRIFGSNASWNSDFDKLAKAKGIFLGQRTFDDLRREMAAVDAALLPMGFGEECALTERTSFKTKFLDYLSFEMPVVIWGPEYCSAVRYGREFDSAEICSSPSADDCLKTILAVAGNPQRQEALIANAKRMYQDRFHPDKIHAGFVKKIYEVAKKIPG